jgi:TonB family protein
MSAFFGHWMVHSLGWTLLHFCWQGALVALLLWCCLRLMGGQRSTVRYGAACLALVVLAALPLATFGYLATAERQAMRSHGSAVEVPGLTVQVGAGDGSAWPERMVEGLDRAAPWAVRLWLAGAVVFLLRLQVGLMVARRLRWMATSPVSLGLVAMFAELRKRMGVARPVQLLHSAMVRVPTVVGWLRPVVLVPVSCFTGLTETQIEAILCHELAHVARHDYLVSVAQSVVEALLFYHPAVWWISKQVRQERECCCDELAVELGGDALGYARALEYLETRRSFYPEVALGANGGVLTMRIKRLLGTKESSVASQMVAMAVLTVMVGVTAASLGTMAEAKTAAPAAAAAAAAPDQTMVSARVLPLVHSVVRPVKAMVQTVASAGAGGAGKLGGTVIDRTGAVIRNARVTVTNTATGAHSTMNTNDVGGYEATGLEPGAYAIEAAAPGFQTALGNVRVDAMREVSLNLKLEVGAASSIVNVVGEGNAPRAMAEAPRQTSGRPQRVSGGVMAGQLISKVDPVYPPEAKAAGIQGSVVLRAVISKQGSIENLAAESGPQELIGSAIDAVKHWVYQPYLLNGEPTEVMTTITVNYSLGTDPGPGASTGVGSGVGAGSSSSPVASQRVAAGIAAGNLVSKVNPVYPEIAKASGTEGAVVMKAVISKEGMVENLQIVSGPEMLRASALDAVKQWVYKPYLLNGEPTEVETTITVNYSLGMASAEPKRIGNGVSAPVPVSMPDPVYTEAARKAKVSGNVLVSFWVDEKGTPTHVQVRKGLRADLDQKAIEAVSKYKFKPAMEGGKPVTVAMNVEVNFQIF